MLFYVLWTVLSAFMLALLIYVQQHLPPYRRYRNYWVILGIVLWSSNLLYSVCYLSIDRYLKHHPIRVEINNIYTQPTRSV